MLFILRATIMSLLCFYHNMHSFLLRLHMHYITDIFLFILLVLTFFLRPFHRSEEGVCKG